MEALDLVTRTLNQRPNARVLVLEHLPEDATQFADFVNARRHIGTRVISGPDPRDQVLVLTISQYSAVKQRMGPVDVCIIHNRYNMARVDANDKWRAVREYLSVRGCETFHTIETDPVLGLPDLPRTWTCGQPYVMRTAPMNIIADTGEWSPCGAENPDRIWYCRNCGMFRGLIAKGV